MADLDWEAIPEVIDPIAELEDEDPEEDEVEEADDDVEAVDVALPEVDAAHQHDLDLLIAEEEDPVAGQLMTIAEHNEIVTFISEQAEDAVQAAELQAEEGVQAAELGRSLAEGLLAQAETANAQLTAALHESEVERARLHVQLDRIILGVHRSYDALERRIIRYPVEEGRTDYYMDRSIVVHMVHETYLDALIHG